MYRRTNKTLSLDEMVSRMGRHIATLPREPQAPPKCPKCNDTGVLYYVTLLGTGSQSGKVIYSELIPPDVVPSVACAKVPGSQPSATDCECRKAQWASDKVRNIIQGGEVPPLFREYSFETYDAMPDEFKAGKEWARYYAGQLADGNSGGLVLSGNVGVGKTGLASCVLMARAQRGEQVQWHNYSRLLGRIRATMGNNAKFTYDEVIDAVIAVPFLLIDDMGDMENDVITAYVRQCVCDIVDGRYGRERTTLITTNLSKDQFTNTFGSRISDRVFQTHQWCDVGGLNLRRSL